MNIQNEVQKIRNTLKSHDNVLGSWKTTKNRAEEQISMIQIEMAKLAGKLEVLEPMLQQLQKPTPQPNEITKKYEREIELKKKDETETKKIEQPEAKAVIPSKPQPGGEEKK